VRQEAGGKWGAASYALHPTTSDAANGMRHRGHTGHRPHGDLGDTPMTPMTPMPYGLGDDELAADEVEAWTL
jgi:hypothetical protein